MTEHIVVTTKVEEGGIRLDQLLTARFPNKSRSAIKKWFTEARVKINGKLAKAGSLSSVGDSITVAVPQYNECDLHTPKALNLDLDIAYEDEYLLVVNKPQGLVVHPAPGHKEDTLVNALVARYGDSLPTALGPFRPGIVHRIDKDTSGLLIVVKDMETHNKLADALRKHEVLREYHALVYGHVKDAKASIDVPIARSKRNRQMMSADVKGRKAVTHFELIEQLRAMSYLRLHLETGRTHQIRVHMKYIGHPVVADPVYAGKRDNYGLVGQALHAARLKFVHPITKKDISVKADLPPYFVELLKKQRL